MTGAHVIVAASRRSSRDPRSRGPAVLRQLLAFAAIAAAVPAHAADPVEIMRRIRDPQAGLIVIAHRGCHDPAPRQGLSAAPENSALALDHCAQLGVDVMETDVRKSRDGHLVIMHDATVDRTTNGTGAVADLTLAQLKALRLRQNEGGSAAPLTDQSILTLAEMLALAKERIVLNLDVKDAIHAEVIDLAARLGAAERGDRQGFGRGGLGAARGDGAL